MKKLFNLALVLCLVFGLCVTATAQGSDLVLFDGEGITDAASFGWNQGLTDSFEIPAPEVKTVDHQVNITMTSGAQNWVQTYVFSTGWGATLLEKMKTAEDGYNYFKLYFENNTEAEYQFAIDLYGLTVKERGFSDVSKGYTVDKDGLKSPMLAKDDSNDTAIIDAGFQGWLYFPCKLENLVTRDEVIGWGFTEVTSYNNIEYFSLDIRTTEGTLLTEESSQILDTISLAKEAEGTEATPAPTPTQAPAKTTAAQTTAVSATQTAGQPTASAASQTDEKKPFDMMWVYIGGGVAVAAVVVIVLVSNSKKKKNVSDK